MSGGGDGGRKVVVTGAAGRLGGWIAAAFARSGAALWLVDNDAEALEAAARDLGGAAAPRSSVVDLREADQIDALFAEIGRAWEAPEVLINNAGVYPGQVLLDTGAAGWDALMDVNLRAAHLMTRGAARLMIEHAVRGSVVNILSRSARTPRPHAVHYAVSKAGLEMLTRGYAMELAPHGVRVNAVSPGLIPGGRLGALSEGYLAAAASNIPLGRFSGPEDAPAAILFLCSEAASFITGASLFVDGGSTAGDFRLPPPGEAGAGPAAGRAGASI